MLQILNYMYRLLFISQSLVILLLSYIKHSHSFIVTE